MPYWCVDAGVAVMALLLAAVDEGLGALFFGQFDHEAGGRGRASAIPADRRPVGTIALGHPAPPTTGPAAPPAAPRRPLDESSTAAAGSRT